MSTIQLPPMSEAEVRVILAHMEIGGQILGKLKEGEPHDEACAYATARAKVEETLRGSAEPSFEAMGVAELRRPRLEVVR